MRLGAGTAVPCPYEVAAVGRKVWLANWAANPCPSQERVNRVLNWICGTPGLVVSWSSVTVQGLLSPPTIKGEAGED